MTMPGGGLYAGVVGQERAVAGLVAAARSPVHAYLLVGPPGAGMREAARSFAAALLCPAGGCGVCEECRRALGGVHPDVVVHERTGPYITVDDARQIGRLASLSPVEGRRRVLVMVDFHLVQDAGPALLKTLEEPPPTTVFVVLADHVPPELVTIASRCARIDFSPIPAERLVEALVADGVHPGVAAQVAAAAAGSLDRARLLASDPGFAAREATWREVPVRLDGTGATVAALVDELLARTETVVEPLQARQARERAELAERARLYGERAGERKELEARHRREERRARTDELRFGLSTLGGAYRDRLAAGRDPAGALVALDAVAGANEALVRNPNVTLLLQALLVRLSRSGSPGTAAPLR
ncbi:MAG: DNA polymerase III subunit delta' [Actinomycetota bacterium]|nr:DNA polymerase III subunit delta' [Actinomycetota bacterium]